MTWIARLVIVALIFGFAAPARADVSELRISKQPGLVYLPNIVMEENKLIEKEAQKRGLDLKVTWMTFNSGGAGVDALLSGNVDMVTSGASNMLLIYAKTNGAVKGVAAVSALPMILVTRNPNVKTLADFTDADKIALPTVKVSMQATALHLAAAKQFGEANMQKLDPLTVSLGHPDAYIALQSGKDVDSHFSLPPYQEQELKLPGAHAIINSYDVAGTPLSNGVVFASAKFHDANPKVMAAFYAALNDAIDFITKDKKGAAALYLQATGEKLTTDQLVAMMNEPHFIYSAAPLGTMKTAEVMMKIGVMSSKPASWKDYFFPEVYNLPGS